ncbi:uncharacterized protein HMPREF1120_01488 [Exophiala dermatitidis NIH/UT8656]|uniref:Uncharacterized protein n=1 Tax=Exophiala dermatitidis (strain ATCC 34100 / CBS 525.76 / NIH/UT8656) TaxID=858893 RepID=H6BP67_EXODN|nr:uncharacterized protein HMPREF1120_01488 [Exophiala dermatitidis NIH/UT8656]EHY53294.1 hypothetical protein HMPREF1120_01488 [Exophiala dermatitidis NIH/UT8656]
MSLAFNQRWIYLCIAFRGQARSKEPSTRVGALFGTGRVRCSGSTINRCAACPLTTAVFMPVRTFVLTSDRLESVAIGRPPRPETLPSWLLCVQNDRERKIYTLGCSRWTWWTSQPATFSALNS